MRFQEVDIHQWFRFREDGKPMQKTSDFGFTDPENKILGEQQLVFLSSEVFVAPTPTENKP